ncbi:DUF1176 domain-containing protein [Sphingomonas sp. M1A8_2b]
MMKKSILLPCSMIVAALAGCSSPSQPEAKDAGNASAPTSPPAPPGVSATPSAPTAAADTHVKPTPGTLKTFGDWTVGCDNGLRCTLGALLPEDGFPAAGNQSTVTLNITRESGPAGALSVKVDAFDGAAKAAPPASFAVDGKSIGLTDAAGLASAIANGTTLTVRAANSHSLATLSLKGAAAALRYIDAQQGRAGSIDAIVAKGPAASTAARPPLPVIAAVAPSGVPAKLTKAQIVTMSKRATCSLNDVATGTDAATFDPETHALGGGKTLVLLPCSTGAYNMIAALFVVDGTTITPAQTDAPAGFAETGADSGSAVASVINGVFKDGVLTSYAKGRGLGDCGVTQRFVWDGTRLRLSEQSEMGECRGNVDYITTWRANVVKQ